MQIKTAEFVKSAANAAGLIADDLPHIVFAGKSNSGKSSLINMLTNNGKLVKVSRTPGSTKLINFFLITMDVNFCTEDKRLEQKRVKAYFVDLPGYGYSKGGKAITEDFSALVENYLKDNKKIRQLLLLIDIKSGAGDNDRDLINFLNYHQVPFSVIATKADKITRPHIAKYKNELASDLFLGAQNILVASSINKTGRDEILNLISQKL